MRWYEMVRVVSMEIISLLNQPIKCNEEGLHVTLERATASERRAARSFAGSSFRRIAPLIIRNRFIYNRFIYTQVGNM